MTGKGSLCVSPGEFNREFAALISEITEISGFLVFSRIMWYETFETIFMSS